MPTSVNARLGPDGHVIVVWFGDLPGNLVTVTAYSGAGLAVRKNGAAAALATVSPVWGVNSAKRLCYLAWALADPAAPGDVIDISWSAGAITLATAETPAAANFPCDATPLATGYLFRTPSYGDLAIAVGTNIDNSFPVAPVALWADLATRGTTWSFSGGTSDGLQKVDALGNITTLGTSVSASAQLCSNVTNATVPDDGRGTPQVPTTGHLTLQWHAPFDAVDLFLVNTSGAGITSSVLTPTNPAVLVDQAVGRSAHVAGTNASGTWLKSTATNLFPGGGTVGTKGTGRWSYRGWYRRTAGASQAFGLFDKSHFYDNASGLSGSRSIYVFATNGIPRVTFSTTGVDAITLICPVALPLNHWVHLEIDYDGTNAKLTHDGGLDPISVALSGVWNGTAPIAICGAIGASGFGVDVGMALFVTGRTITTTENPYLLNGGFGRVPSDLGQGGTDGASLNVAGGLALCIGMTESAGSTRADSAGAFSLAEQAGSVATSFGPQPVPIADYTAEYDSVPLANLNPALAGGALTYAPQVGVKVNRAPFDASKLRVWGPGITPDGSQEWFPQTLRRLGRPSHVRAVSASVAAAKAGNNCALATDYYGPRGGLGHQDGRRSRTVTIASVAAPTGAAAAYGRVSSAILVQLNCPSHGIPAADDGLVLAWPVTSSASGVLVKLSGGPNGDGSLLMSDGAHLALNGTSSVVRVFDANTLVVILFNSTTNPTRTIADASGITGTVDAVYGGVIDYDMLARLCVAAGCDLWLNFSHITPPSECAALVTHLLGVLGAGRKIYGEISNESWNGIFNQSNWFVSLATDLGLASSQAAYAHQCAAVHAACQAAVAGIGRAGDYVDVYCGQASNPGGTMGPILDWCSANGVTPSAYGIAPYWNSGPHESALGTVYDAIWASGGGVEAFLTLLEAFNQFGAASYSSDCGPGRVALNTAYYRANYATGFPDLKLVAYEEGAQYLGFYPGAGVGSANGAIRSHALHRHPRIRAIELATLEQWVADGLTLATRFNSTTSAGAASISTNASAAPWGVYAGIDQLPGAGDGSDGWADNRAAASLRGGNWDDFANTVSVRGHEFMLSQARSTVAGAWNATLACGAAIVAPGSTTTVTIAGTAEAATTLVPLASSGAFSPTTRAVGPGAFAVTFTYTGGATQSATIRMYAFTLDGKVAGRSAAIASGAAFRSRSRLVNGTLPNA